MIFLKHPLEIKGKLIQQGGYKKLIRRLTKLIPELNKLVHLCY